ncbi:MAG: hypothetical protein NZ774_06580 [Candidatus Poseidoniales archaeon]|nr:hypothetical protein [Candidatus Poseidoniales archaeon]
MTFQNSWLVILSIVLFILLQLLFPSEYWKMDPAWQSWIFLIPLFFGVFLMLRPSLAKLTESGEPTSPFALVFAIAGLFAIMSVSALMFDEWSGSAWQFGIEECENAAEDGEIIQYESGAFVVSWDGSGEDSYPEKHWNFHLDNCRFSENSMHNAGTNFTSTWVEGSYEGQQGESDFSVEGPTMASDYSTEIPFGPDGPYLWVGYFFLSVFIAGGMIPLFFRSAQYISKQSKVRNLEVSTIRKLALDPDGVVEGRIELPPQMEPSPPSEWETNSSKIILVLSTTLTIIGLMAILLEILDGYQYYRWNVYDGDGQTGEFVLSAFLLAFIMFSFLCSLAVIKLLNTTINPGEESLLESVRPREESSQQELPELLAPSSSDEAARLEDVIQSLEHQMIMARLEAETLSNELKETKVKVSEMETELEDKSEELDDMKSVLDNMQAIAEKSDDADGKSLMMSDSVLVGDALFGSTKIDSQIVNDPAAIARAAIEAYREGRRDGGL